MFEDMGNRGFVEFLAAFWESRGWETGITERDEGVFMITGDRGNGERGLMLVVPDPEAKISGQLLQKLVTITQNKGVEVGVAATRGSFSQDAEAIASANGVHLLDPATLEETVHEEGATDLVERFSGETAGDGGGDGDEGSSLVDRLPIGSVPGGLSSTAGGAVRTLVVLIVVFAVVFGAVQFLGIGGMFGGAVAGLPLPDIGGSLGGDAGYTMTAVSLTSGNGTAIDVRWNARTQSTIVAPNGASFDAPEGKTFVVVAVNVSNPSDEPVIFRADYLALATGDTRYGNQPLQGASGQLPMQVEAGSSASGYVVYTVPAESESGTLLGLPGGDVPPMTFERDRDLAFPVSE